LWVNPVFIYELFTVVLINFALESKSDFKHINKQAFIKNYPEIKSPSDVKEKTTENIKLT
jgi:hypothetical protein